MNTYSVAFAEALDGDNTIQCHQHPTDGSTNSCYDLGHIYSHNMSSM